MRRQLTLRRLVAFLLAISLASPAWAADQWNAGTLTGTGRTETLTMCYAHTSSRASCLARRATSVTNAVTVYDVSASAITATTLSPTSPATANTGKLMLIGGNSTTLLVGGGGGTGRWLDSSPLSSISWTREKDESASGYGFAGIATPTSPDKTFQHAQFGGSDVYLFNISIGPWSFGNLASNTPTPGDQEVVGVSVSSSYYCIIAGEYSSGTPTMRGYASGTSFAFTTTAGTIMSTGTYFYPPFGLSATACISTHKKANNSHTYIMSAPIGGTITTIDAGVIDLIPLGDWDPTGSLRRPWWVNKADGTVRVGNSATAPTSVSTNATYDIGSTPLGGSTPLFAITGLDVDQDGDATDNPVVMMADGSHFAWWGTPASSGGGYRAPKRNATGPFNSYPFVMPNPR